jgi:hypothetical protein
MCCKEWQIRSAPLRRRRPETTTPRGSSPARPLLDVVLADRLPGGTDPGRLAHSTPAHTPFKGAPAAASPYGAGKGANEVVCRSGPPLALGRDWAGRPPSRLLSRPGPARTSVRPGTADDAGEGVCSEPRGSAVRRRRTSTRAWTLEEWGA